MSLWVVVILSYKVLCKGVILRCLVIFICLVMMYVSVLTYIIRTTTNFFSQYFLVYNKVNVFQVFVRFD